MSGHGDEHGHGDAHGKDHGGGHGDSHAKGHDAHGGGHDKGHGGGHGDSHAKGHDAHGKGHDKGHGSGHDSHGKGHDAHGGHGGHGSGKSFRVDSLYDKLLSAIGSQISSFVAFLFLLFTAGAFYGVTIASRFHSNVYLFLLAPLALALFSYYNRTFATIVFFAMIVLFIL